LYSFTLKVFIFLLPVVIEAILLSYSSILSSVLLSTVLIIGYYIWNTNNLILDIDNNKISVTYSAGELTKIRWVKG
jgi:hypothetical protein